MVISSISLTLLIVSLCHTFAEARSKKLSRPRSLKKLSHLPVRTKIQSPRSSQVRKKSMSGARRALTSIPSPIGAAQRCLLRGRESARAAQSLACVIISACSVAGAALHLHYHSSLSVVGPAAPALHLKRQLEADGAALLRTCTLGANPKISFGE